MTEGPAYHELFIVENLDGPPSGYVFHPTKMDRLTHERFRAARPTAAARREWFDENLDPIWEVIEQ